MSDDSLESLREKLAAYNTLDLAAGIGALQLVRANATRQLRFERLATVVASLEPNSDGPTMSVSRWRALLNKPPIADAPTVMSEDPAEELFTESVSFTGGANVIFPGIAADVAPILRHLLRALFLSEPAPPAGLLDQVRPLAYATLRISNAIAKQAELERRLAPEDGTAVFVPSSDRFRELKQAVVFQGARLGGLLGTVPRACLAPLILPLGGGEPFSDETLDLSTIHSKPILSCGDALVVPLPAGLPSALRHAVLVSASGHELLPDVADRLLASVTQSVKSSLRLLTWSRLAVQFPEGAHEAAESAWMMDSDKIAHVFVATDDLENYDAGDPFGEGSLRGLASMEGRLPRVRQAIRQDHPLAKCVLHLIVVQGVGRMASAGLPADVVDADSHVLMFTEAELAIVARAEAKDPLALWKFAEATARLHETTSVMSFGCFDEFSAYRSADHSFYLSDGAPPNALHFATSWGTELRQKDSSRFDSHGVPSWNLTSITEVQRRYADSQVPIYVPHPAAVERVAFLVNDAPLPIWVVEKSDCDECDKALYYQLVETVAYWVWQLQPHAHEAFTALASHIDQLRIFVCIESPEEWRSDVKDAPAAPWLETDATIDGTVQMRFRAGSRAALATKDNAGEREIVRSLEASIATLNEQLNGEPTPTPKPTSVTEKAAPLGQKKKLLLLESNHNVELAPGPLPPVRLVHPADTAQILDGRGAAAAKQLGLRIGPIDDRQRVKCLNAIVATCFKELEAAFADLEQLGLLERLIALNESTIRAQARFRLTIPTRAACFGIGDAEQDEIAAQSKKLTATDLAGRFLIEYAAARPPTGSTALTLSRFDHLLALASYICELGYLSDAIQYGIADVQLSILPSGRLGTDRTGAYVTGLAAFGATRAREDVAKASADFERHWQEPRPASSDSLLASAFKEEFGFTDAEMADLHALLIRTGMSMDSEPKVMPLSQLTDLLKRELGWSQQVTERAIQMLAMVPRSRFVPRERPPAAFPWRFNRELSYLRKPVAMRGTKGSEEVVWGIRHVHRSATNLMSLVVSGRLKAESQEMRRYLGARKSADSEAFNDEVADWFDGNGELIVRRRLEKLGQKRIERNAGEPLGDVDVLVVHPGKRRVWALETKDFEVARTPAEFANEVEKLLDGQGSAVTHSRERVAWLEGHLDELLAWLSVPRGKGKWRVLGCIIVSRPLVSMHIRESSFPILGWSDLREGRNKLP